MGCSVGKILVTKFLKPNRLTQEMLARALDIPKVRISEIIDEKRAITADTDLRLCRFFCLEEGYFLRVQLEADLKKTKKQLGREISKITPWQQGGNAIESGPCMEVEIALICGGPSLERGISLNSARSVLDHLSRREVQIFPYYIDVYRNFYRLSASQLYSNTPSDFDFKLSSMADKLSLEQFIAELQQRDIVFPVIHGLFGEDGELQALLERHQIPFVGSDSRTCQRCFDKHAASAFLKRYGFPTLPSEVLRKDSPCLEETIRKFFTTHQLNRAVVKPIYGGSSIGVFSASTPEDALQKTLKLFQNSLGDEALLEPFCTGREFTVIVLQNTDGSPVALVPTEIQVSYDNGGIFDYRRKYLPTTNTFWFCPPRFEDAVVERIRRQAEDLFRLFHMRDFARIDGWLLNDGSIFFTDFNPISGMEQNSFIFQQASRIGLTHGDLLWNVLKNALSREKIPVIEAEASRIADKEPVHILFGGSTAERQVSLMSGTNVWLKLKKSSKYAPEPYLLDHNGCVWHLPYTYSLNHTVEEIYENCLTAEATVKRMERFLVDIQTRLAYAPDGYCVREHIPKKLSLNAFLEISKEKNGFVFIALHGGEGENGILQKKLQEAGVLFNGSGPMASELCMDKYLTGQVIAEMGSQAIRQIPKKLIRLSSFRQWVQSDYEQFWQELMVELGASSCVIKPRSDGCSAGIVRLNSAVDLSTYIDLVQKRAAFIPEGTFSNQNNPIEMPYRYEDSYLLESFIETDYIRIARNELVYRPKSGWIELTVGVLEYGQQYHSLNPSITVAEGDVLSVEEKFQGGTGVNITPPLESIVSLQGILFIKNAIEEVARALHIQNYARIDIFYNVQTSMIYVIEANSLPALTPATVLYQQALAEQVPIFPREFLESLIDRKRRNVPENSDA